MQKSHAPAARWTASESHDLERDAVAACQIASDVLRKRLAYARGSAATVRERTRKHF